MIDKIVIKTERIKPFYKTWTKFSDQYIDLHEQQVKAEVASSMKMTKSNYKYKSKEKSFTKLLGFIRILN